MLWSNGLGSGLVQSIILVSAVALGSAVAFKNLRGHLSESADCAAQRIANLGLGAIGCPDSDGAATEGEAAVSIPVRLAAAETALPAEAPGPIQTLAQGPGPSTPPLPAEPVGGGAAAGGAAGSGEGSASEPTPPPTTPPTPPPGPEPPPPSAPAPTGPAPTTPPPPPVRPNFRPDQFVTIDDLRELNTPPVKIATARFNAKGFVETTELTPTPPGKDRVYLGHFDDDVIEDGTCTKVPSRGGLNTLIALKNTFGGRVFDIPITTGELLSEVEKADEVVFNVGTGGIAPGSRTREELDFLIERGMLDKVTFVTGLTCKA